MNGILGMAQMLMMDGVGKAKRKEFVRTILGSGQALLAILNDILDLSKIEAGKMELNLSPFDATALVEDVAALFHESAKTKGISLVVRMADSGALYMGHPIRLRQMLSNYVAMQSNSRIRARLRWNWLKASVRWVRQRWSFR